MIDIRSDTVTLPTAAMRRAMAEAEVGDDVYGDDPEVNRLEALAARITGKEAALFTPSGTFANQLALFTWCERGSEVILGEESHIVANEAGGAAVIAGVQLRCVSAPDGVLPADEVLKRARKQGLHEPFTSLVCLENTHSSGRPVPLERMDEVRDAAKLREVPVHLDGARIFNAALALGCSAQEIAARADSVMLCLSKGLCAPVGSMLAGPAGFIEKARLKRKIMGGGMRQAGVLAAAGIIALSDHPPLLAADHDGAKKLARGLAKIKGLAVDLEAVLTNMVFFAVKDSGGDAGGEKAVAGFAERGVKISAPRGGKFRFVTHHWIGEGEIAIVLRAAEEVFA